LCGVGGDATFSRAIDMSTCVLTSGCNILKVRLCLPNVSKQHIRKTILITKQWLITK
jgi:hypothetical protein